MTQEKKKKLHLVYEMEIVTDVVSDLSYNAIYLILYDALKKINHPLVKEFYLFRKKDYEEIEETKGD